MTDPMTEPRTELRTEPEHDPAELGELERSILQRLWQHGQQTAEQVREALGQQQRSLKDSTIRTVLRRLEDKGYVRHSVTNRTFVYAPAEAAPVIAGRAARRIVDRLLAGSVEALLVGLVDSEMLDPDQLRRLADRVAAARAAKTSSPATEQEEQQP